MKNRYLIFSLLPLVITSCLSNYHYKIKKDISYGNYEVRNLLDIAFPKEKTTTSLIVYIHGGAWIGGSKSNYAQKYSKEYDDGYIYAAINYRYASETYHCNDILDDIQNALLRIKDICNENNYIVNNVALFGHSAGGHLSLLYGYKMKGVCPFNISFVSSLCGPTDLSDERFIDETALSTQYYDLVTYMTGVSINESNFKEHTKELLDVSPINYIDKACPTIICHGDKDELVPYNNALTLKDKLEEKQISYDFFTYTGSGHALDKSKDIDKLYKQKFKEYKEKYLA